MAGKRAGLEGSRSSLFYEANIRIIDEMRRNTNGRYPRFAVWENVPGALSSNQGEDFRAVVEAFAEIGALDVAWRIRDARYFGVPQRRRRIFVVADFGGERVDEVLFECEGVCGDSAKGAEARQDAARHAANSAGGDGESWVAGTLMASGAGRDRPAGCASKTDLIVPESYTVCLGSDPIWACETAMPLTRRNGDPGVVIYPVAYRRLNFGTFVDDVPSSTLSAREYKSPTDIVVCYDPNPLGRRPATFEDFSPSLKARAGTGGNNVPIVQVRYRVRRLTPTECERLQGYPDGWTKFGRNAKGTLVDAKDTSRYKSLGNSVAVPVVEWIMRRIVALFER